MTTQDNNFKLALQTQQTISNILKTNDTESTSSEISLNSLAIKQIKNSLQKAQAKQSTRPKEEEIKKINSFTTN